MSDLEIKRPINRRNLVKAATAGVGAIALGGLHVGPSTADEPTAIRWDSEADVVVIGTGAMGLPAAPLCSAAAPARKRNMALSIRPICFSAT